MNIFHNSQLFYTIFCTSGQQQNVKQEILHFKKSQAITLKLNDKIQVDLQSHKYRNIYHDTGVKIVINIIIFVPNAEDGSVTDPKRVRILIPRIILIRRRIQLQFY